ncbi:hypothetical protein EDD86DRAFT_203225 [Gorgonomyces haynaldii]|nr:hypothetical protein EDD86DRAFT_203225 [Gorgonomyces haynaldii]
MISALLPLVFAQKITRIDVSHDVLTKDLYSSSVVEFPAFDAKPDPFPRKASIAEPFSISMYCPGVSTADCDKAKAALQRAGQRIASQIQINTPVNINFTFHSFCPDNNLCTTRLGQARAASYFVVKDVDNSYVTYPSALLKQLKPDKALQYRSFDIIGDFNSQWPWKFTQTEPDPAPVTLVDTETGRQITLEYFDFELVAAHEITHGLGFYSGMLNYNDATQGAALKGYLAPLPFMTDSGNLDDATGFKYPGVFQPLNVFDQFITAADGTTFKTLGKTFAAFKSSPGTLGNFITSFEATKDSLAAGQKAFLAGTSGDGNLNFVVGNTKIPLSSPLAFKSGSSLSHVQQSANTSANFLMTPAIADKIGLDAYINQTQAPGVYGPNIVRIMNAIGYPAVDDTPKAVTMATDFNPSSKSSASKMTVSLLAVVFFMLQ